MNEWGNSIWRDAQNKLGLFLLSCAQVTFMIDSQMVVFHNEQMAYFSQKATTALDNLQ